MNREQTLHQMGLGPLWKLRVRSPATESDAAEMAALEPVVESLPSPTTVTKMTAASVSFSSDWTSLEKTVSECRLCGLCDARKQAVFGVGDANADWLFVGEGPGAEEDQRGEPFVGQAGKLLDAMLASISLWRGNDVYIANAVKCRPPENRTPEAAEISACRPYLEQQISMLKPKLIVALGRPAAQSLLQTEVKIGAARGQLHRFGEIPVIVTYHPAYLLRNLTDKAKAWEDLCFMRRTMKQIKG